MEMFFLCVCVCMHAYIYVYIYFFFLLLLLHCTPCKILGFLTRNRTCARCVGRAESNHCPSREALNCSVFVYSTKYSTVSISQKLIKKEVLHFVNFNTPWIWCKIFRQQKNKFFKELYSYGSKIQVILEGAAAKILFPPLASPWRFSAPVSASMHLCSPCYLFPRTQLTFTEHSLLIWFCVLVLSVYVIVLSCQRFWDLSFFSTALWRGI